MGENDDVPERKDGENIARRKINHAASFTPAGRPTGPARLCTVTLTGSSWDGFRPSSSHVR
ncbi:hypothetical protein CCC_03665 [Paramagnetospirillum magnetotacticum MS-1]|uniref:Uncharacterized protein n=1 Tax=Paramagnetospirillum magnetotacticum MS-1 TaxID=272627 RepID=A0A0C2UA71_PARME|nr:hypothetical protein CCC_03665 [Paramagnetospirillum magnetotacticum MS-1]